MIDRRPLHAEALADLDAMVSSVEPADLERPTPCRDWNLRELLAHLIGQHHGFAAAVRADTDVSVADFAPRAIDREDWRTTRWAPSLAALLGAIASAPLDRPVLLPELSPSRRFPVGDVVSFHLVDTVAHAWDAATTLGRDYRPSDALVAAFLDEARRVPGGDARNAPGAAFGPVIAVAGDPWREGLGLLGRDVVSASRSTGMVGP